MARPPARNPSKPRVQIRGDKLFFHNEEQLFSVFRGTGVGIHFVKSSMHIAEYRIFYLGSVWKVELQLAIPINEFLKKDPWYVRLISIFRRS